MHTRVKICGITNLEDALHAVEAGADALGFVFYENSPRFITPNKAREIIEALPPFVETVGLFVNATQPYIDAVCFSTHISLAQIHFEAETSLYETLQTKHLKVVRAQEAKDVHLYKDEFRIVDAYVSGYGGEGKRLNLEWFDGVDCSRIILAGGLTPENLHEAKAYGFYALDVSSGVEKEHGIKDHEKVKTFIQGVKS